MEFLLPANEVWGKVIFSVACVKNSVHRREGRCLPQCMLGYPIPSPWDQATPPSRPPPRDQAPPGAVHAGKYGQWAGSMHPTGMQSCMTCFLNVFTEFAEFGDKNICHYSKRTWTCHLLCERPRCYHITSKTHVRDRIFKLNPIHASVIYQIP